MKIFKRNKFVIYLATLIITAEILLRLVFGFANPALYQPDPDIGYLYQPNQKIYRFGKNIEYNQYSQRSETITREKLKGTRRIFMIGDSVLNGGNPTDQSETITALLENKLSAIGKPAQVLNASAGSWGIGNQLAYIERFGLFESDILILQIGTGDLAQAKSIAANIINSPNHPTQRPISAIWEASERYVWNRFFPRLPEIAEIPTSADNPEYLYNKNTEYLQQIIKISKSKSIPVIVLYTCDRADLMPKFNNPTFKKEFINTLKGENLPIIDSHEYWSKLPIEDVNLFYRDEVHYTVKGNQAVADLIINYFNGANSYKL